MGRACKVAFTYGFKMIPEVAAKFMKKLTTKSMHEHITPHASHIKPAKNLIPLQFVTNAFSGMPK